MKALFAGALAAALLVLVGCQTGDSKAPAKADSFTMTAPGAATAVKPGETQSAKLTFNRGAEFKQTVKLSTEALPGGIKAEIVPAEIKAGDKAEVEVKITAENEAKAGAAKITVVATPEKGDAKKVEVPIKVEEAKKPS